MGQRRLLVILLVVATALVDLMVAVPFVGFGVCDSGLGADKRLSLFGGLATSQISLLAAFVGWGTIRLPWGLMSVVLTAAYLTALRLAFAPSEFFAMGGYEAEVMTEVMILFLTEAVMTFTLTLIIRAMGLRAAPSTEDSLSSEGTEGPRFQFTLGHMFAWITTTAVILGILRYTIHLEVIPRLGPWHELALICSVCPTLAILAVWAVLAANYRVIRILPFSLATLLALVAMGGPLCYDFETASFFIPPQFVWLLAATLVLRVAGYRLVRRGAISRAEVSPPMDGESG